MKVKVKCNIEQSYTFKKFKMDVRKQEFKIKRVQNYKSSKYQKFKIDRVQNSKSSKLKEFKIERVQN